jgi:hypothetical protein
LNMSQFEMDDYDDEQQSQGSQYNIPKT